MKKLVDFFDRIIPKDERPVWAILFLFAVLAVVMVILCWPDIVATM